MIHVREHLRKKTIYCISNAAKHLQCKKLLIDFKNGLELKAMKLHTCVHSTSTNRAILFCVYVYFSNIPLQEFTSYITRESACFKIHTIKFLVSYTPAVNFQVESENFDA